MANLTLSKLNTKTKIIDLPEQAGAPSPIEILDKESLIKRFSPEEARKHIK